MTWRRKLATWLVLALSLAGAGYGAMGISFYGWLNAAQPEVWTNQRALLWAGGFTAFGLGCLAVASYCIVTLAKRRPVSDTG